MYVMLSKYSSPLLLTLLVAKHGLIVKKEWITESYVKKRRLPASKSVILCVICTSFLYFALLTVPLPSHVHHSCASGIVSLVAVETAVLRMSSMTRKRKTSSRV